MKRIISILLTAAMLTAAAALPIQASTWVTVSSWAYNDVSNFKKEGMLPESFEDVADYTQSITRLQFAELLYSALLQAKVMTGNDYSDYFADTDSRAANALRYNYIMQGEIIDEYDNLIASPSAMTPVKMYNFYPDRLLTREEMAVTMDRTVSKFCSYLFMNTSANEGNNEPTDINEISDWAIESVGKMLSIGMLSGMDDGSFAPKDNLTIEQAIVAVYSLYSKLPTASEADGANINSDTEVVIQTYSNGLTETKKGNILYLKNGDNALMEFETDIYSNIYCSTVNGVIYAVAQNCYGQTDVYNTETKEILFKIPYPTASVDEDYINIKSSSIGPMTFGLYDYSGNEILEPKYSMEEISEIKANGMEIPQEEYQEASGWIYYINRNDGETLYRIDSNGENKQKVSDNIVSSYDYINGWIYYCISGDETGSLYCVKADGTREQRLTDTCGGICANVYRAYKPQSGVYEYGYNYSIGYVDLIESDTENTLLYDDTWVYYCEYYDETDSCSLWRVSMSDEGAKKEKISGDLNVSEQLNFARSPQVKNGKVYFTAVKKADNTESEVFNELYCYDGETLSKIETDKSVISYGFNEDKLVLEFAADDGKGTEVYLADMDGSNTMLWQEVIDAKNSSEEKTTAYINVYDEYSDESFTVCSILEYEYDDNGNYQIIRDDLCVKDSSGKEIFAVDSNHVPKKRIGNLLYAAVQVDTDSQVGYNIIEYDMETGKSRTVATGMEMLDYGNIGGDDWFTYTDFSFNTWRYDADTDTLSEIFPNANLKRYGRAEYICTMEMGIYKVDIDGNYSLITDDDASSYGMYVENGKSEGIHFYNFVFYRYVLYR